MAFFFGPDSFQAVARKMNEWKSNYRKMNTLFNNFRSRVNVILGPLATTSSFVQLIINSSAVFIKIDNMWLFSLCIDMFPLALFTHSIKSFGDNVLKATILEFNNSYQDHTFIHTKYTRIIENRDQKYWYWCEEKHGEKLKPAVEENLLL